MRMWELLGAVVDLDQSGGGDYGSRRERRNGVRKKTFEEWKSIVDSILLEKVSMTSEELPDMPYRRWYDEGKTPAMAARGAIALAKTY